MSSSGPPSRVRTRVVVAGLTDVGRQRKHNEDCVLIRAEHGLFVVADGMGGHNAGDVASKLVATSLGNYFEATANGAPIGDLPAEYSKHPPGGQRLAAGVRKANLDVFTISNTVQQHHGMGSTVVGIHVTSDMVHIAHVGDSRCYRIRGGVIQQMTRDHSLINDALELKPDLTKEELARLPKNIITRALGMKDGVKVDIRSELIEPGDTFLLCSDGLTGMVPPDQILEVINVTGEPQEACELLIAEANDAGGTDNISALIVRLEEAIDETVAVTVEETDADLDAEGVDDEDEEDGRATLIAGEPAAPAERPEPAPMSTPTLQLVPGGEDETVPFYDEGVSVETAEALFNGGEIDLDLQGPWPRRVKVRRCVSCNHELLVGNSFCVECGTRIDAEPAPA
jgi:protein phosphatase